MCDALGYQEPGCSRVLRYENEDAFVDDLTEWLACGKQRALEG